MLDNAGCLYLKEVHVEKGCAADIGAVASRFKPTQGNVKKAKQEARRRFWEGVSLTGPGSMFHCVCFF